MAEENGQIAAIGEWVLNKACQQMRRWKDSDNRVPRIAVNLSPRQLLWPDLIPGILTALRDNALEPSCLELEITEGAITNYTQEVIDILSKIREIGVSLAIDDFGTGYSSLSVLKHAPVDRIKIDRSFVQGLPDDADDAAITEAIVAIAQKMKLQVVAEGVESLVQLQYLQDAGCDVIQGYFTGYPMTVEQFDRYLADSVAEKRRWRTCWRAERPWGAGSTLGGGAATYHYLPANFLR